MASLLNLDLENLNLNLPDVVAEAAAVQVATASASTASPSKKSVRSRRNRRNGGTGGTKKPLLTSGDEVGGSSEVSAVVVKEFEDLDGVCALAPRGTSAKGGVSYDQRVPNINLSNLEDFLEAVEASTDEEKAPEKEAVEDEEPNIEGAGLAMFDSLAKVQAETPKKGRSRKNKKGGKRKRKPETVGGSVSNNSISGLLQAQDQEVTKNSSKARGSSNKENVAAATAKASKSKSADQDFPFDNDSDNDEEPKYLWRNVTKNGCIKKCVLVDGKMELGRPKPGDTVLVKSQGKLKDGTIVDDYPTLVFNIGEYEVVDGLDLVVQSMYKNELSIVSIKPELAYGEKGRGNRAPCGRTEKSVIPGNCRITYLFGLLHFEKAKEIDSMTWAQRRKSGQSRLRLANWWYQRKEYPIAVKCYKKALEYYNDIQTNKECSSAEEYKELLQLMEERLRVMRQVANIFKRIANLIQSGEISV